MNVEIVTQKEDSLTRRKSGDFPYRMGHVKVYLFHAGRLELSERDRYHEIVVERIIDETNIDRRVFARGFDL